MITLKEGQQAPDFELCDGDKKLTRLIDFSGKKLVLYFYPRDDTPGCTKEACDIRDNFSAIKKLKVEVLGVSSNDAISHKKFASKYNLPFRLLADTQNEVSKKYGSYELKKFMGREYYGITRSTFIIDEKGKIMKIFYKVNPEKNIDFIFDVLEEKGK